MTEPLPRPAPIWLPVVTAAAVGNVALQLAVGSRPLYLIVGFALLGVCAALQLCFNPRLLRPWAVLTVAATFLLLAVGQFVTSFGAGMADPVWPTEPWYVFHTATEGEKAKFREQFGFFIEHTHRIVGWTVGGLVVVLAVGALWTAPRRGARWVALAGLVVMVAGYGEFHRGMMAQRNLNAADVVLPARPVQTTAAGLAVMLLAVLSGFATGARGTGLRLCASVALVAVMVQGLLGGFRVKLNELAGTDLAAFHGVFAQVVFGLLVSVAVLTAPPRRVGWSEAEARLSRWAAGFAALVFVQIALGAWLRHFPAHLPQRLHFLTAFAATAMAVWLLHAMWTTPAARLRAGWVAWALAGLLVLQLYLGVEAWLARFGQYMPPQSVVATPEGGAIRSLHALVGSGVWAAALALAIRLRRTAAAPLHKVEPVGPARVEVRAEHAVETV